jgi:hypothetical protein
MIKITSQKISASISSLIITLSNTKIHKDDQKSTSSQNHQWHFLPIGNPLKVIFYEVIFQNAIGKITLSKVFLTLHFDLVKFDLMTISHKRVFLEL